MSAGSGLQGGFWNWGWVVEIGVFLLQILVSVSHSLGCIWVGMGLLPVNTSPSENLNSDLRLWPHIITLST